MENNRLPHLCNDNDCTGCSACVQSCKHEALKMVMDAHGFLHPQVDAERCVGCLLCEKRCPIGKDVDRRNEKASKVVACWYNDERIRMTSSSGGAFTAIAVYVLSKGGIVWGAAYGEELNLSYQCVDSIDELDKLRRSKYLQCEVGDAFLQIRQQLENGRMVLFVGTSCHIRGLYQVVGQKLKDNDNLITVDFVCHGVPSPKVFYDYITWIQKKYDDKLIDFNFRDKRYGWDNGVLTVGRFANIGERKFMNDENSYFTGMLNNMFLRECCFHCTSNGIQRHSDFTIADFWGIGRMIPFEHEEEKTKGISMVALNSSRANDIFNHISSNLTVVERSLEEAVAGNGNYEKSSLKNPKSDMFWTLFNNSQSWDGVVKFLRPTFAQRCKLIVKRYFGPVIANKLRKLIGR